MSAVASDWTGGTIDDLVTHETKGVDPSDADGLPYVGLEHIDTGEMSLTRSGEPTAVRSRKTRFEKGDILYGKLRPYLDKAVLAAGPGICSTDILVLRPKSGIDPYFAGALLHLKPFLAHAVSTTSGVNHPRTSWNAIRAFEVAVPPLPEQRAIAHVLRAVQRAKEATDQVIAAAKELKKSLMRHLFTYGPTPLTKISQVGMTTDGWPSHWEARSVEEIAEVMVSSAGESALSKAAEKNAGDAVRVTYLKVSDLAAGGERYVERSGIEFSLPPSVASDLKLVPIGSTVFPKRGAAISTNRKRQNLELSALDPNLVAVVAHSADPNYLFSWFENFDLRTLVPPDVIPQINKKDIAPLPIAIPPLEEQARIVESLEAVSQKIAAENARRDALVTLFDSLLHDLMTARVRVTDLNIPA
jgi:type I restriction enzyme S subunit